MFQSELLEMLSDDNAAFAFREEEHPRVPKGKEGGGRFTSENPRGGGAVKTLKYGSFKVRLSRHYPPRITGTSLNMPNYRQHDDHSCGFVGALSVVQFYDKNVDPKEVLKVVKPTKSGGINRYRLIKALRELGVDGKYKSNLDVGKLRQYVKAGTPVLLTLFPEDWSSDHWVAVQGFSQDRIYLTNYKSLTIPQFKQEWFDVGEGIICRRGEKKRKKSKALSIDAHGREHGEKGSGHGGQFIKSDDIKTLVKNKIAPYLEMETTELTKKRDETERAIEQERRATDDVNKGLRHQVAVSTIRTLQQEKAAIEAALNHKWGRKKEARDCEKRLKNLIERNVSLSIDKTGREHRGKGPHGGEFVQKSSGLTQAIEASVKARDATEELIENTLYADSFQDFETNPAILNDARNRAIEALDSLRHAVDRSYDHKSATQEHEDALKKMQETKKSISKYLKDAINPKNQRGEKEKPNEVRIAGLKIILNKIRKVIDVHEDALMHHLTLDQLEHQGDVERRHPETVPEKLDLRMSVDKTGREHAPKGTSHGGEFVKKGASSSQKAAKGKKGVFDEKTKKRLREQGMHGTFPPPNKIQEGPFKGMEPVVEGSLVIATPDMNVPWLMKWQQRTKSGRISGQFRYTKEFLASNADDKWERVKKIEPHIDKISRELTKRLSDKKASLRDREAACITSVIRETGLRPTDSGESVQHGHFGISSLQARHVKFIGAGSSMWAKLDFIGKEGVRNQTYVKDPDNVKFLREAVKGKKPKDFVFSEANSNDAGDVLKEVSKSVKGPSDIKLKDLRTLRATQTAREIVKKYKAPQLTGNKTKDVKLVKKAILEMSGKVAEVLCNTATQARDNYIMPQVWQEWQKTLKGPKS